MPTGSNASWSATRPRLAINSICRNIGLPIRGRLLRFGASAVPEAAAIVKTFAATMAISGGDTRDPEIGREREEEIPGD